MGWKVSSIIVSPKSDIDFENLLEEIGFTNLKEIDEQPYENAVYPEQGKIYIGTYKNNLIISEINLPSAFFSKTLSALEEKLIDLFPDAEI